MNIENINKANSLLMIVVANAFVNIRNAVPMVRDTPEFVDHAWEAYQIADFMHNLCAFDVIRKSQASDRQGAMDSLRQEIHRTEGYLDHFQQKETYQRFSEFLTSYNKALLDVKGLLFGDDKVERTERIAAEDLAKQNDWVVFTGTAKAADIPEIAKKSRDLGFSMTFTNPDETMVGDARGIGVPVVFASTDYQSFKSASDEEAEAIKSNCAIKIAMTLSDEDAF